MTDESRNQSANRVAYRAFRDAPSHSDDLFGVYRQLYASVPRIEHRQTLRDIHAFEYCQARRHFVIIAPYTKSKEVLAERSFANDALSWVLLGGSVRHDLMETFIEAAHRHALRGLNGIELSEVEPVAFLRTTFVFGEQECVHEGVAFAARIRNPDPYVDLKKSVHSRAHFIPLSGATDFTLTHNAKVVETLREYLSKIDLSAVAEEEISENLKYEHRYRFHGAVVKPLFRFFGRTPWVFKHSLQDLESAIDHAILEGPHSTVLDVACGENTGVMRYAEMPDVEIVVGNDVSWSQVRLMTSHLAVNERFRNRAGLLLFTNHDARRMPFADDAFDFVLCKNVLHHMDSLESVNKLVDELLRVGKRALIVEIMDPKFESAWGRLRHKYYLDFLHDAGSRFLSRQEFKAVASRSATRSQSEMQTIRGVYQFMLFDRATAEKQTNNTLDSSAS